MRSMLRSLKEISFEGLEQGRSYKLFKMAIKSPKTLYQYRFPLREFFKYTHLASFDELAGLDTDKIQNLLENWIIDLSARGVKGSSIRGKLAPIELFLEMNRVNFYKRILHKLIPRDEGILGGDVPFTNDDIKQMLGSTKKLRTKAFVHFLASTGVRPGALVDPILRREHITEMQENCLAIRVYDNSKEGYWAFLTPEAKKTLYAYFKSRELNGEILTDKSPIFVNEKNKSHLTYNNLKQLMHKLLKAGGITRMKNGRRYDKAANYGFRKRFNGILKMNNNVNSNIAEKLMAHKKGLDGSYLKPTREQCFEEFRKAIQDLTVDPTEKQKIKIEKLEVEKSELEDKTRQIAELKKQFELDHLLIHESVKFLKRLGINVEKPDGTPYEIDENLKIPAEYLPEPVVCDKPLVTHSEEIFRKMREKNSTNFFNVENQSLL